MQRSHAKLVGQTDFVGEIRHRLFHSPYQCGDQLNWIHERGVGVLSDLDESHVQRYPAAVVTNVQFTLRFDEQIFNFVAGVRFSRTKVNSQM